MRSSAIRSPPGPKGEEIVRSMKRGAGGVGDDHAHGGLRRVDPRRDRAPRHRLRAEPRRRARRAAVPAGVPAALRWIDVDFAPILDYKWDLLTGERASCLYETAPTDLTDGDARRALFAHVAGEQHRVLIVTEGLLIYLTPADVGALATDLHDQPAFRSWVIDLASPRLLKWMQGSWGKKAAGGNAPFRFAPAEGTGFFARAGWREREFRSSWMESKRLNRQMPGAWLWAVFSIFQTKKMKRESERMSGIVMLERSWSDAALRVVDRGTG